MIFGLDINLTCLRFPPPDVMVIVEGGVARWNGKDWISNMYCSGGRVIQWEVKWWAHLPINPFNIDDKR